MTGLWPSLLAFLPVATLLTIMPGADTLLVARTAAVSGRRCAAVAVAGIALGCLCWAVASALGITALLAASRLAFDVLRWAGAAYLLVLGIRMLWRNRHRPGPVTDDLPETALSSRASFGTGLLTNLLNPKIGVFYLSVLPQFLPRHEPALVGSVSLALAHVAVGIVWCTVLILLVHRIRGVLTRPSVKRRFEQVTGLVFIGFGVRLAAER